MRVASQNILAFVFTNETSRNGPQKENASIHIPLRYSHIKLRNAEDRKFRISMALIMSALINAF